MSFYNDWLHYKNNRSSEENSHSEQELLTELGTIEQNLDTESLAYKIDRYVISKKIEAVVIGLAFGLLVGLVFGVVMYGIP